MPRKLPLPHNRQSGQMLMDILIATAIFAIMAYSIFTIVTLMYETISSIRTRVLARHLGQEKVEALLNLPYSSLGTANGIPHGPIPEYETIVRNDLPFIIHTSIVYVDDPFDNTAPSDLLPNDYKQIRVAISWEGLASSGNDPFVIVSTVSPKGMETSVGGGTLSVFVIDAMAQPVPDAVVHITSTQVTPNVDVTLQTNQDGRLYLPGAQPCSTCYNVTVTKDGFSTDKTYSVQEVAYSNKQPVTVIAEQISEAVFVIDRLCDAHITSYSKTGSNYVSTPGVTFRLTGSKTIGNDLEGDPVYKYDKLHTTSSSGTIDIEGLEWDSYLITLPQEYNLDLAGVAPFTPFSLAPGNAYEVKVLTYEATANSILMAVKDASGSALASASATLNLAPSFSASASSGLANQPDFGQVFFPNLDPATYAFTVALPGYTTSTGTVSVVGDIADEIILQKQ